MWWEAFRIVKCTGNSPSRSKTFAVMLQSSRNCNGIRYVHLPSMHTGALDEANNGVWYASLSTLLV